jgi:rhamnose utilization protein RhaD (predicted bifunctional aldolase and dehydrogenase)
VKNTAQRRPLSTQHEIEIASLLDLSARVGCDPLLAQGSNGNTSVKIDGVLWIKASGKWLANAMQEEMLVPIDLTEARESIRNKMEIWQNHARKNQLRPSIETAMHAVLRRRVVIHLHSINTIAWAIRQDGPVQLKERLAGLHWQWVPYASSGIPLAREIKRIVADAPETDILILANHGLVICGNDCDAAEELLCEVERRLAIIPRRCPDPDGTALAMIARLSPWRFPDFDSLHALGTDAVSRRILKGGILYPCQATYLGGTMPLLTPAILVSELRERLNGGDKTQTFVVVERGGVMINERMTSAERATLIGLMQVVQRTEESAPLRYLTAAEVMGVLGELTVPKSPFCKKLLNL